MKKQKHTKQTGERWCVCVLLVDDYLLLSYYSFGIFSLCGYRGGEQPNQAYLSYIVYVHFHSSPSAPSGSEFAHTVKTLISFTPCTMYHSLKSIVRIFDSEKRKRKEEKIITNSSNQMYRRDVCCTRLSAWCVLFVLHFLTHLYAFFSMQYKF